MKAGLITFHRADNMGAVLQAAATQHYIRDNGWDCELVDFVPNNQVLPKNPVFRAKRMLLDLRRLVKKDKVAKFRAFRRKYYRLSPKTYEGDRALRKNPPKYDVVISGSDQIFNTTLSGTSESFYLTPWENTPKISYASSFGREELSPQEQELIARELPKFTYLSAREASAARMIREKTGREVPVVLDPVFLPEPDFWRKKCGEIQMEKSYILVYAMEYSKAMEKAIRHYMQTDTLYLICGSESAKTLPGTKLPLCGPEEFLRYIQNAKLVLTNSFHGTAFSMIFGKPLVCVAHTCRNARLENIMNQSGNAGKLVTEETEEISPVDGGQAYRNLMPLVASSRQYLLSALEQASKSK